MTTKMTDLGPDGYPMTEVFLNAVSKFVEYNKVMAEQADAFLEALHNLMKDNGK